MRSDKKLCEGQPLYNKTFMISFPAGIGSDNNGATQPKDPYAINIYTVMTHAASRLAIKNKDIFNIFSFCTVFTAWRT